MIPCQYYAVVPLLVTAVILSLLLACPFLRTWTCSRAFSAITCCRCARINKKQKKLACKQIRTKIEQLTRNLMEYYFAFDSNWKKHNQPLQFHCCRLKTQEEGKIASTQKRDHCFPAPGIILFELLQVPFVIGTCPRHQVSTCIE